MENLEKMDETKKLVNLGKWGPKRVEEEGGKEWLKVRRIW